MVNNRQKKKKKENCKLKDLNFMMNQLKILELEMLSFIFCFAILLMREKLIFRYLQVVIKPLVYI